MSKIMRELYAEARGGHEPKKKFRYSCRPDDVVGYPNWQNARSSGKAFRVQCDGILIKDVVMADEAEGIVIAHVNPHVIVNNSQETYEVRGTVVVELV